METVKFHGISWKKDEFRGKTLWLEIPGSTENCGPYNQLLIFNTDNLLFNLRVFIEIILLLTAQLVYKLFGAQLQSNNINWLLIS